MTPALPSIVETRYRIERMNKKTEPGESLVMAISRSKPWSLPASAASVCWLLFAWTTTMARGDDWPGWRGPRQSGISQEKSAPREWTADRGIRWKKPLAGGGIASPIVWSDRVLVATSDGPKQGNLHLLCFHADTGETIWDRQFWGTAPTLFHASKGGMASPTPVTDGEYVFAFYGTGDVFCVDMNGLLCWHRSLADEYGAFENRFGHTSSPVLLDDVLIVQCDHYGLSYLVAIDKRSGANRWRVERPGVWHSWSSPILAPVGGQWELVICSSEAVEAFDPRTGDKLWRVTGMERECIPTAVFAEGLVYAVSGPKGKSVAIKPGGRGDIAGSHIEWESTRGGPFVPSPIVTGGQFCLIDDAGIATALDARTGERVWQKRLHGEFTASPVSAGDLLYFTNEAGETFVVRAGQPQFEQLARNTLDEPVYASPAISNGRIYFRTARHLVCVAMEN